MSTTDREFWAIAAHLGHAPARGRDFLRTLADVPRAVLALNRLVAQYPDQTQDIITAYHELTANPRRTPTEAILIVRHRLETSNPPNPYPLAPDEVM